MRDIPVIFAIDDQAAILQTVVDILKDSYRVRAFKSGKNALKQVSKEFPDLILLDYKMPGMDGHEVFNILKSSAKTKTIPVIFLSSYSDADTEASLLAKGAADYINKPIKPQILLARVRMQLELAAYRLSVTERINAAEQLGLIDSLTGLANRRCFDRHLESEWKRAARSKSHFGIMIIDVDNFKDYNDAYGHPQGDILLQVISDVLKKNQRRPSDLAARWGGEEFAVILPDANIDGTFSVAERIRRSISALTISTSEGLETKTTVSIGVYSEIPLPNSSQSDFVAKADKALYRAKSAGKNKVIKYGSK